MTFAISCIQLKTQSAAYQINFVKRRAESGDISLICYPFNNAHYLNFDELQIGLHRAAMPE